MRKSIYSLCLLSILITSAYGARSNNWCVQRLEDHTAQDYLWLTQCGLQDSDIPEIISYLDSHQMIRTLYVEKNKLTNEGAALLANNKYLEKLHIDQNNIGAEGAAALIKHDWGYIDISNNHIGDQGAVGLSKLTALKILIATNNNIGDEGAVALAKLPDLKELNLMDNPVSDKGAIALAKNSSITRLKIGNQVGDAGAEALAHGNFEYLEISGPVTHIGASALANYSKVEILTLIDNKIGDQGAGALANSKNKRLTSLAIINNNIGDEGAAALAKNQDLQQLALDHNQIGNQGAFALAAASGSLYALSVAYNHIGPSGLNALHKKFDPFLMAEGNDGPINYLKSNTKTAPDRCPTVEALQSVSVDHAKHEKDGWVVSNSQNHRYDTKEVWQFGMLLKNNYDHEYFALQAGKEALKKFSFPIGPYPSSKRENSWVCHYVDEDEAIGQAITPPAEMNFSSFSSRFNK